MVRMLCPRGRGREGLGVGGTTFWSFDGASWVLVGAQNCII